MEKIKRIIAVILCSALIITAAPFGELAGIELTDVFSFSAKAADTLTGLCGDNATWSLNQETGLLEISGSGPMSDDMYSVWGDDILYIKDVVISEGITTIGNGSFKNCTLLESVSIPSTVEIIGNGAFYYCRNLTNVALPNNVTAICEEAFSYCYSLESILIPESVKFIGEWAFDSCHSLTDLMILDGIETIGKYAFACCDALTDVILPDSVKTVGYNCFYECTALETVKLSNSLTVIPESMFSDCESLKSIVIPSGITTIEDVAFAGCTSLDTVYFCGTEEEWSKISIGILNSPLSEAEISTGYIFNASYGKCGENAIWKFNQKTGLLEISGSGPMTDYYGKTNVPWAEFCSDIKEVNISDDITTLTNYVFCDCTELTKISLPKALESIGIYAFRNCGIKSLIIPEGVKTIGANCFKDSAIETVVIPSSVKSIGSRAFWNCSSLSEVTLCEGVTGLVGSTFLNCVSLETVVIPNSMDVVVSHMFHGCSSLKNVTIPENTVEISSSAFLNCTTLEEITIPDSVTNIGYSAFEGCSGLTSIQLPVNLTQIEFRTFFGCEKLESIVIRSVVTDIAARAFEGCASLNTVYFEGTQSEWNNVTVEENNENLTAANLVYNYKPGVLSYGACGDNLSWFLTYDYQLIISGTGEMYNYSNLGNTPWAEYKNDIVAVEVNSGVENIGIGAFYGCKSLKSVTLSDTLADISLFAFGGCTAIESITVDSNNSFYHSENGILFSKDMKKIVRYPAAKSGEQYNIPECVTVIGKEAFADAVFLKKVFIPESVNAVEYHAFYSSALIDVNLPSSVKKLGNNVFDNCLQLKAINVASDNKVYKSADGVLYNKAGTELIFYPPAKGTMYYIPEGVETVKENAFLFSSISTLVIPDSLKVIEASQFKPGYGNLTVHYSGSPEDWAKINIDNYENLNLPLINAEVIYNSGVTSSACKISIRRPLVKEVKFGDVMVFEAVVNNMPEGAKIVWSVTGKGKANYSVKEGGMSCHVTASGNGEVKVTAKVVDKRGNYLTNANGNIINAQKSFSVKSDFFDFIMWLIKSIFGITTVYMPETML